MTVKELAQELAGGISPKMTNDYFEQINELGLETGLSWNDVYSLNLALLYFLSQRSIFGEYEDPTTYCEYCITEITSWIELNKKSEDVTNFYRMLDILRAGLRVDPHLNAHKLASEEYLELLGYPEYGESCPSKKIWLYACAIMLQARKETFTLQ